MRSQIVVLALALINVVIVLELVRRRRLHEHFAMLWMTVAGMGIVLVLARPLIDRLSSFLGIRYGTSLLFTAGILFLVLVCLYLSLRISRLETQVERLAERVTFLAGPDYPDDSDRPGEVPGSRPT